MNQLVKIRGAVCPDDSVLRLGGNGDDFYMTWAADGRVFMSQCDGCGWSQPPRHFYNTRLHEVIGGPEDARFVEVENYPELSDDVFDPTPTSPSPRYYGLGILAVNGAIYQYLSTLNVPLSEPEPRFVGAKLIWSPDNGVTWRNQDGSPAAWETWEERTNENMVFFNEPGDAFSQLTILQMGRNYEHNRDGYVYVYGPNGNVDGVMNQLVMFRVKQDAILDRTAYQFFAGLATDGSPEWSSNIERRAPTVTFPFGWVNRKIIPWGWLPSVVYNEPLGLYMMSAAGTGCAPDGSWFGKPSYLGMWSAPTPWGPWTQFHEETAWMPARDPKARCYAPVIAPQWISDNGKSFWLSFGDFQNSVSEDATDLEKQIVQLSNGITTLDDWLERYVAYRPNYTFNLQRVELIVE